MPGAFIPPPSSIRISSILGTAGNAVLTPGSTTYGTDYTAQLQSLLNAYAGWKIIGDGRYSHTGLTIPSYTDIEWLPGCGTILRGGANAQLYQNANLSLGVGGTRGTTIGGDTAGTVGNITDQRIRFRGGVHNCNVGHQTATSSSSLLHGTRFWGVQDIRFADVTFIDGSLWFANCEYFGARDVTCINSGVGSAGPQLNGPCRYGDFENITCVNPSDDGFAMNADDGAAYQSDFFPYPFGGPITDITLRNLRITGGQQGLRFLSTSQRIDRIIVDGVSGDTKYEWAIVTRFVNPSTGNEQTGTLGPGNIGSISISNVDVNITAIGAGVQPIYTELNAADVFVDSQFETLSFANWKKDQPAAIQPALFLSPVGGSSSYGVLKVSNFAYLEGNAAHSGPSFLLSGNLQAAQFAAPSVIRNATAGQGDSPLIRIDPTAPANYPGTSSTGPTTVLVSDAVSVNCNSVAELASGAVPILMQIDGHHIHANGNAAVTVAPGTSVLNLDTSRLRSVLVSGKKWSGAGAVTNYLDSGASYAE